MQIYEIVLQYVVQGTTIRHPCYAGYTLLRKDKIFMKKQKVPFYRNLKIISLSFQALFFVLVVGLIGWLLSNMFSGLARQNLVLDLDFMTETAGFSISEGPAFSSEDSYWKAFFIGVLNSVRVAFLGIVFSTVLGVIIGSARLSPNLLARMLSTVFVEVFRNIPLLVQLFVWYYILFLSLPGIRQAIEMPGAVFLSNRGIFFPWLEIDRTNNQLEIALILAFIISMVCYFILRHSRQNRSNLFKYVHGIPILVFVISMICILLLLPNASLKFDIPTLKGFNFKGGIRFTPEFMALLTGLTIYTAAFIAEIVRGSIQAVPKGQTEAALALGLTRFQTFTKIVFPQALRIILPPLANQHLNLIKNSSLAIAIGFADIFQVSQTITNQSGNAVSVIILVMFTYLMMSLLVSALINWFNRKTRIIAN